MNTKPSLFDTFIDRMKKGLFTENPIFVQAIGMCPTLAVTSSAENAFGMGLAATTVLIGSNVVISAIRRLIPEEIRIPVFIVIIAGFVTLMEFILAAWFPVLNSALGIFIPLIVVNCIILGRAEGYASKQGILPSLFDALWMGLGFTIALLLLGSAREVLGAGTLFGREIMPKFFRPATVITMAPGGFLVLGLVMGAIRAFRRKTGADAVKCSACPGCDKG